MTDNADVDSESEESWADDILEDPERGRALDAELARRAHLLETRKKTGEWCTCGYCFPVGEDTVSAFDVTCCQEDETVRDICQENELFKDKVKYPCVTQHPAFYHLVLYERKLISIAAMDKEEEKEDEDDEDDEEEGIPLLSRQQLRCLAYKGYGIWVLQLEYGRRVPQCVHKAIRRKFPDPQQE